MTGNGKGMVTLRGLGHGRCVALAVFNSWGKESYANVKLIPKDSKQLVGEPNTLTANKFVLAAASKKLAAILPDGDEEDLTIIFPDQTYTTLKLLLQYIYSGHVVVHQFPDELRSFISDWDICSPEIVPVVSRNAIPTAESSSVENVCVPVPSNPTTSVAQTRPKTYQRSPPASSKRQSRTEKCIVPASVNDGQPTTIVKPVIENTYECITVEDELKECQQTDSIDQPILITDDAASKPPRKKRTFKPKLNTSSKLNGYVFLATYLKTTNKSLSQKIVATSKAVSRRKTSLDHSRAHSTHHEEKQSENQVNSDPEVILIESDEMDTPSKSLSHKIVARSKAVSRKKPISAVARKTLAQLRSKSSNDGEENQKKGASEGGENVDADDLIEADEMDAEEDRNDLEMSLAYLKEEETYNKELTETMKELSHQLQRHKSYVKHFFGDENPSLLAIESKALKIPCRICNKLVHRDYMVHHVKIHTVERPYLCEQCGQTFALPERLRVHLRYTHANESQLQSNECPECGKKFKKADYLQRHMTLHNGEKPYACPYCPKRFRLPNVLLKHKRVHTGEKPYECEVCRKRFSARTNFVVHLKTHGKKTRVLENSDTAGFVDPETQLLKCDICGTTFHREYAFLLHKAAHKGEEPKLPCRHCTETFGSLKLLREHTANSHPETFHKCEHCSSMFVSRTAFQAHVLIHTGDQVVPCDLCNKEFKTKTQLETHRRNVHPTGRPFPCKFCEKAFKSKLSLRQHERIHTDERPYQCPHCPKAFRQDVHLANHIRLHTGEKPFVCSYCGKAFSHKNNLSIHIKIHTGDKNQCATCGKVFRSIVKLRLHEETHASPAHVEEEIEEEMVGEMC